MRLFEMNIFLKIPYLFLIYCITICANVGAPILLLLLSPIYLYRWFISKIGPKINPKLCKILPCSSCISAVDDMYTDPNINIGGTIHIQGAVDIEDLRNEFFQKIILAKNPKTMEFMRPELRQRLTSFGGFFWWAEDEDFDITKHIKFYDGLGDYHKYIDRNDIVEISIKLLKRPYMKDRPLWEMFFIPNYMENDGILKTVIFFRTHHALADGFSVFKLTASFFGDKMEDAIEDAKKYDKKFGQNQKKKPNIFLYLFRAFFEIIPSVLKSFDLNQWRLPPWKMTKQLSAALSPRIPMTFFKEISQKTGFGVTSILLAGISGGLRQYMIVKGVKVPRVIHAGCPVPWKGHEGHSLQNHLTLSIFELPVGLENRNERLLAVDKMIKRVGESTLPGFMFIMMRIIGGLFSWMIKPLISSLLTTALITTFPGPSNQLHFLGSPVDELTFGSTLLPGNAAIGFTTLSYCGGLTVVAGGDKKIIESNEDAKELVQFILQEFEEFQKINSVV